MMMAAMRGRREMCALLVRRGADRTIKDDMGRAAADMCEDAALAAQLRNPDAEAAEEEGFCVVA